MSNEVKFNSGFISIENVALVRFSAIKSVCTNLTNNSSTVEIYLKNQVIEVVCETEQDAKELLETISGKILGELE